MSAPECGQDQKASAQAPGDVPEQVVAHGAADPAELHVASGDNHTPVQAAADPAELHEPSYAATPCRRQRTPPKCTDRSLAQLLFVPTGPQFGFTTLACRNDDMSLPLPHDAAACHLTVDSAAIRWSLVRLKESQRIAAPAVPGFDDVIAEHVAIMRQASFGEFYEISSLTKRNLPAHEDTWRVGLSVCHHARCSNTDVVVHPGTPKPLDIGRVLAKCGGSAGEETRITVLIGLRSRVAVFAHGLHTPLVRSFIRILPALHKEAFQHSGSGLLIKAWNYYRGDAVVLRRLSYSFTALCVHWDQDFSRPIESANKFLLCTPCQIFLREDDDKDDDKLPHVPRPCMKICVLGDAMHCEAAQRAGIPFKSVEDLKKLNKNKKMVKKLALSFDAFLASQTLISQIPSLLGPGLYEAGKFPGLIQLTDNLENKVTELRSNGEHFPDDDEDDEDGSSMYASDVPGLDPWY
ncbi:unnamed protein product [Polarella glacialis]|uniref:Uncharacterized protein n=1 Tax=Polarella glacialis TaxID=89957 RepID=A0A813HJK1_POLGL|nr:unnamed protein product [Polarella glacialis]